MLLVEDNAEVAQATAGMLRAMGFSVSSVDRARKALERIEASAEPVDLLLTDIVMPDGMNGLDLAREARIRFPGLPILLMSGYNDTVAVPTNPDFPFCGNQFRSRNWKPRCVNNSEKLVGARLVAGNSKATTDASPRRGPGCRTPSTPCCIPALTPKVLAARLP